MGSEIDSAWTGDEGCEVFIFGRHPDYDGRLNGTILILIAGPCFGIRAGDCYPGCGDTGDSVTIQPKNDEAQEVRSDPCNWENVVSVDSNGNVTARMSNHDNNSDKGWEEADAVLVADTNVFEGEQAISIPDGFPSDPDRIQEASELIPEITSSLPNSLCPAQKIRPRLRLENIGVCNPPRGTVTLRNNITGNELTQDFELGRPFENDGSGPKAQELEFELEIPSSAPTGEQNELFTFEVESNADINPNPTLNSKRINILEPGEMRLDEVNGPTNVCADEEFTVSMIGSNIGDCNINARARFENITTGDSITTDPVSVAGNDQEDFEFSDVMSIEAIQGSGGVDIRAELQTDEEGSFQSIGSRRITIGGLMPDADIIG